MGSSILWVLRSAALAAAQGVVWFGVVALVVLEPHVEEVPQDLHREEVVVVRVVDGDTVDVRVARPTRVRLANADAWESRRARRNPPVTEQELVKGRAATRAVEQLLRGARVWVEYEGERDSFGRVLARVLVHKGGQTVDLGEWLEEGGHVRRSARPHP